MKCSKAIIPVAGYGTRRLPVTKAVEKCMLPLLNRPIIDYVVEDCIRAGVSDIYFVVSANAVQLRRYYERDEELEEYLRSNGKERLIPSITPPEGVTFHFIEQDQAEGLYGTAVPVWLAKDALDLQDDESVLIIMGDQCLYRTDGGSETKELIESVERSGSDSGMIAVPVPEEDVEKYGIIEIDEEDNFVQIVEKPSRAEAPSNLNNASFYLFDKALFTFVDRYMSIHRDGEYYLTDPINEYVIAGHTLHVKQSKAAYLDCGIVEGWVAANQFLLENS
ncbi:hypothetical protein CYG49_04150 [Candidatus Saccharibacteria bacterium]|nr:MAG: hypothetical protein CYG49_04150 [Candidatus Saccharibacteria bacterium]